ncbi:MAG: septum formation initiator family protein [Alphaproteobacteria bacterium]|nr:septum formation initiator family protein [Alphaproteobacteria bacterium]
MLRELRRRARVVAGPVLGLFLAGYFAYHLVEGDRGLLAWLRLTQELRAAKGSLAAVEAQRTALDRKVANMRSDHIDPDLLDERVRGTLDAVAPNEIVIMRPPAPSR